MFKFRSAMKKKTKSVGPRQKQPLPSKDIHFDHENPEAFIQRARDQAVTTASVEHQEGMTVDLLVNMCHGLVTTNQEIWERCKPFCCKTFKPDDSSPDKCVFYRVRHLNAMASSGILTSTPHVMKITFEIPISLPAALEYLVANPRPEPNDFMPNYGRLLQQSMLLIDELIPIFLYGFKAFLENQQVALGHVDAWLFHENEHELFLKDQFGLTVNYNDPTWHRLFVDCSAASICCTKCSRCEGMFCEHQMNTIEDWVTCNSDNRPGSFPIRNSIEEDLLRFKFPGKLEFNISIETPDERSRLMYLLKFMGHTTAKET